MILPTKRLPMDRSLLGLGADVLVILHEPKTVSRAWEDMKARKADAAEVSTLNYESFILALDLLFLVGAVEMERGRVRRVSP